MGQEVLGIVRLLITKGVAFCAYRFPDTELIKLSLPEGHLPDRGNKSFWIAPFTGRSTARELKLSVVDEADVLPFAERLKTLPDQNPEWGNLPEETSKDAYIQQFSKLKHHIEDGTISKAILSRVILEDRPEGFDEVVFFATLCAAYRQAFIYLFYHPEAGMWAGATPELLVRKEHDTVQIMAIAGTQPLREGTYEWRAKEIEEHAIVGRHIEDTTTKYNCKLTLKKGPFTVEAARVAHLRTDYTFREMTTFGIRDFISSLHPTPAIGGYPILKSQELIMEVEPYDRRYYCGFLGETDFDRDAALYVNLRCMQIGGESVALYVGGGITIDSDAEEEWEETVMKSRTLGDILKTEVAHE